MTGARDDAMDRLRVSQILFPTDYSEASLAAGRMAANLARRFEARLHVVHVVPPVTDPGPADAMQTALAELGPGLDVLTAVIFGRPTREIVAYAARHGIDMIVMGTHGRTGVAHALLGSVAAVVVRRATCPVLTVPGRIADESPAQRPQAVDETARR
jgi:nucleotide-binding universal stress UspA family protein